MTLPSENRRATPLSGTEGVASPAAAYDLEAAVLAGITAARTQWVPLAQALHTFHTRQAWKHRDAPTFREWLAQPEIGIQYRTAKDMIDAVQELIVDRGMDPGELAGTDASKIAVVIPALRARTVDAQRALADCRALTRADLRDLYRRGPDEALEATEEPRTCVCPMCGRVHRQKKETTA